MALFPELLGNSPEPAIAEASEPAVCVEGEQVLRPYQQRVVDRAVAFTLDPSPLRRILFASPTGTGKGTIQLAIQSSLSSCWILTPSLEVLRGYLERRGVDPAGMSGDQLATAGELMQITTPTRFRNRILTGDYSPPAVVIYDEVHHAVSGNEVAGTLFAVAPGAVWLGFTATAYRGSPRGTQALREDWGPPEVVLTVPEAIKAGWMSCPTFEIVPLVDDDVLKVEAGEFVVKAADTLVGSRVEAIADLVAERWDRPTAVAVPGSEAAELLCEALGRRGVVARWVNQSTKTRDRQEAYEDCKHMRAVLVDIATLTEGVDFPWLAQLIDAQPTVSPVRWMQRLGRIMRPKDERPVYITVCRNLERHAYLMQGAVPREVFVEAQTAFEQPSKRSTARVVGLEAASKFKVIELPLIGGATGLMYTLQSTDRDTAKQTEYVILMDPSSPAPICASRVNGFDDRYQRVWGRWAECQVPSDFTGYATSKRAVAASEKQLRAWSNLGPSRGLDPGASDLTSRQVAALFVLKDIGRRLQ